MTSRTSVDSLTATSASEQADPPAVDAELVSLVMPVWATRPDWLRAAVASALGQQGCRLEVVVVDDGCPGPVSHLLTNVEDERMQILRVEHGGPAHARNAGFRASRGGWIRFVDADDVLVSDSTARLLAIAGVEEVIAYAATRYCDADLEPLGTLSSRLQGWVAEECLLNRFPVTVPSMLFPRAVVERAGGWDPSIVISSDWDFVLKALDHAPVRGTTEVATLYRRHGDSLTSRIVLPEHGVARVVDRYFERHPERVGTRLERRARAVVELIVAGSHRDAYLAHLGRAYSLDRRAVAGEVRTFAALTAQRAISRVRRVLRGHLRRSSE